MSALSIVHGGEKEQIEMERRQAGVVLWHILKWAKTCFCLLMQIEHKTKRGYGQPLPPHMVGLITFYTLCCCWRQLVDFPKQRLRLGQLFIVHLLVVFLRGRKKSKLRWRVEFLSHILKQRRGERENYFLSNYSQAWRGLSWQQKGRGKTISCGERWDLGECTFYYWRTQSLNYQNQTLKIVGKY